MTDPEPFDIYALTVGGGIVGLCPLPTGEMDRVTAWSPDLVIAMVEAHEMPVDLWDGFLLCHLPVIDYGTPIGDAWSSIQAQALAVLSKGGRVLVHCKGGCGRSGMAVLRLMLAAGEVNALTRLRDVRHCAVETDAQLAWAEGKMG